VLYGFGDAVSIHCNYETDSWDGAGSVYECKLQNALNIKSRESVVIDSSSGNHSSGKSNADVTCFFSVYSDRIIEYFPSNLKNIFINLKMILINKGRLKEIQQSDLSSFSKLVRLDLEHNDIATLEDGLFAYNPELAHIHFANNKIIHIGSNVFENLNKLAWLLLSGNTCISMNTDNNQKEVRKIISQAEVKCFSYSFIEKELQKLENSLLCVNSETFPIFDQNLQNLQSRFQNSSFSHYLSFKDRFQAIVSWKSKNIWSSSTETKNIKTLKDYSKYILIGFCSILCLLSIALIVIYNRFGM